MAAVSCSCAAPFLSILLEDHIAGFLMPQLNYDELCVFYQLLRVVSGTNNGSQYGITKSASQNKHAYP